MEQKIPVEKIKAAIQATTAGNGEDPDEGTQTPLHRLVMSNAKSVFHKFIEDLNDCQMAFLYQLRIDLTHSAVSLSTGDILDKALKELLPGKDVFEEKITDLCQEHIEENLSYWDYGNPMRDALLAFGMILGAKAVGACDEKLKVLAEAIAGQQDEN